LCYGPTFRTLHGMLFLRDHALGAGQLSSASESWENHSYFHPAQLDGGLHPLACISHEDPRQSGQTRLPFQIAETKLACCLASVCWFTDVGLDSDDLRSAHLMSRGSVHAIFDGFELKALRGTG
jgi:hypothetical protein